MMYHALHDPTAYEVATNGSPASQIQNVQSDGRLSYFDQTHQPLTIEQRMAALPWSWCDMKSHRGDFEPLGEDRSREWLSEALYPDSTTEIMPSGHHTLESMVNWFERLRRIVNRERRTEAGVVQVHAMPVLLETLNEYGNTFVTDDSYDQVITIGNET